MNQRYFPDAGVDYVMMDWAKRYNRRGQYLEPVDQQFQMLVPSGDDRQLNLFETVLRQNSHAPEKLDPLVAAWSQGDEQALGSMMDVSFAADPDAKKILVTDRNRKWA